MTWYQQRIKEQDEKLDQMTVLIGAAVCLVKTLADDSLDADMRKIVQQQAVEWDEQAKVVFEVQE